MPPKKKEQPPPKTAKLAVDKTFGLKNVLFHLYPIIDRAEKQVKKGAAVCAASSATASCNWSQRQSKGDTAPSHKAYRALTRAERSGRKEEGPRGKEEGRR